MRLQADLTPATVVVYAVGMAVTVYVSLWVTIRLIDPDVRLPAIFAASAPTRDDAPREAPAVVPRDQSERLMSGPPMFEGISGLPGDSGVLVGQMQLALTRKGYRISTDNHFNADTVSALQAFQDARGLTVHPTCDRQCWIALGLSDPK